MMRRMIKAYRVCFRSHGFSGRRQRHQQSDSGFFTINNRIQFPNHADAYMVATFNRYDNFLDGIRFILKKNQSINATVRTFLFTLIRLRVDQGASPPLELVFTSVGQVAC